MAAEPLSKLEIEHPDPRERRQFQMFMARYNGGQFQLTGTRTGRFRGNGLNLNTRPKSVKVFYPLSSEGFRVFSDPDLAHAF